MSNEITIHFVKLFSNVKFRVY